MNEIIFGTPGEFTLGDMPVITRSHIKPNVGGCISYYSVPFYKGLKQEYRNILIPISYMVRIRVDLDPMGKEITAISTWYFDKQAIRAGLSDMRLDPLTEITINLLLRDSKKLGYYCAHKLRKYIRNYYGKENN